MKRKWIGAGLGSLIPLTLSAVALQTPEAEGEVWGIVTDPISGEPVPNILVVVPEEKIGDRTGQDGRFTLSPLPLERTIIRFEHPCFHSVTVEVGLDPEFPLRRLTIGMPYDFETEARSGCDWRMKGQSAGNP